MWCAVERIWYEKGPARRITRANEREREAREKKKRMKPEGVDGWIHGRMVRLFSSRERRRSKATNKISFFPAQHPQQSDGSVLPPLSFLLLLFLRPFISANLYVLSLDGVFRIHFFFLLFFLMDRTPPIASTCLGRPTALCDVKKERTTSSSSFIFILSAAPRWRRS